MAGEEHEPGDLDDDLPPLVDEDGEEHPADAPAAPAAAEAEAVGPTVGGRGIGACAGAGAGGVAARSARGGARRKDRRDAADVDGWSDEDEGEAGHGRPDEEDTLRAAMALQARAAMEAAGAGEAAVSAEDALKGLMAEAGEERPAPVAPDAKTMRLVAGISKDDFEECEDAIMQGADVHAELGAGMRALHITALRGNALLTELLIAHGATVNDRDLSGNTPLLYACHFYRQHGRGVQLVSQLLHHRADPFYRVRDGKLAGKSAHDLMEKACGEPNTDEDAPRQMRAMLQLAMEGREECNETITKMWMHFKSKDPKLYQVSSKKDKFDYAIKSVDWVQPEGARNAQACEPVKLQDNAESILEEKFTYMQEHMFVDEGDKVKVYVTFPGSAGAALADKSALRVDFELQALDVKLRTPSESYRLRVEPLYGTVEVSDCKFRVSAGSHKVTLTLAKRHKNRVWPSIQKPR